MTDSDVTTEYSTTEHGLSFPSHFLPAAIITAVFIALILMIIIVLKLCNCIRQRALTRGLTRIFQRTDSEKNLQGLSQEELPVFLGKNLEGGVALRSSLECTQIDLEENNTSHQFYDDDVKEFIECARIAQSLRSASSTSSSCEHRHMGACSDEYIVYNLDHDGEVNMTVEVEMHPKELQCYCADTNFALSTV